MEGVGSYGLSRAESAARPAGRLRQAAARDRAAVGRGRSRVDQAMLGADLDAVHWLGDWWSVLIRSSERDMDRLRHRLPAPAREHRPGGVAERPGLAQDVDGTAAQQDAVIAVLLQCGWRGPSRRSRRGRFRSRQRSGPPRTGRRPAPGSGRGICPPTRRTVRVNGAWGEVAPPMQSSA